MGGYNSHILLQARTVTLANQGQMLQQVQATGCTFPASGKADVVHPGHKTRQYSMLQSNRWWRNMFCKLSLQHLAAQQLAELRPIPAKKKLSTRSLISGPSCWWANRGNSPCEFQPDKHEYGFIPSFHNHHMSINICKRWIGLSSPGLVHMHNTRSIILPLFCEAFPAPLCALPSAYKSRAKWGRECFTK